MDHAANIEMVIANLDRSIRDLKLQREALAAMVPREPGAGNKRRSAKMRPLSEIIGTQKQVEK